MARAAAAAAALRLLATGPRPQPLPFSPITIRHLSSASEPATSPPSAALSLFPTAKSKPPFRSPRERASSSTPGTISDLVHKSRLYNLSFYRSLCPMRSSPRRKIKRIHLPTHYVEVSYKLRKAVVFYQPSIAHIPHGIKERNPVLVTSGTQRGQNT